MQKKVVHIGGEFQFQRERVSAVINALENGDISECKAPDVKYVADLLDKLRLLGDVAPPEFLNELFSKILPSLIHRRWQEQEAAKMQEKAEQMGVGDAYRRVAEAAKHKNKKGLVPAMVDFMNIHTQGNQQAAMSLVSQATGQDVESIRRNVARHKGRNK